MEPNAYSAEECDAAAAALVSWFRRETWTKEEGFLLLAGIDPHRTSVGIDMGNRQITSSERPPTYVVLGAGTGARWDRGPKRVKSAVEMSKLSLGREVDRLVELMDVWHSRQVPQSLTSAAPAYFVEWAESKGLAPFWLAAVRKHVTTPLLVRHWPWGAHETALLRHLAAAASYLWANYDPSEPDTAPTNKMVSNWLQDQGVTERIAESMATILRADGLRTGPR